jgi:predicted MFS family arabinose efflux permease
MANPVPASRARRWPTLPEGKSDLAKALAIFEDRNYRWYVGGNFASTIGLWVQRTAIGWLTWELTHSATWLGWIALAETGPTILIGLYAGAVLDRLNHLGVLRFTQSLTLLYSVLLFVFTYLGLMDIWVLAALVLFRGTVFTFNRPARQTVVYHLVGRDQLMSALSLNAVVFQSSKFIGPAIAGTSLVFLGVAWTFAIGALLVLVFTFSLSLLETKPTARKPREKISIRGDMVEGLTYIMQHAAVRSQLVLLIVVALFAKPLTDLFPGFAGEVFGQGAGGLAWLLACHGGGASAAGIWLTFGVGSKRLIILASSSIVAMGISIILFASLNSFILACVLLIFAGFSFVVMEISSQTLVQSTIRSRYRGRTMSIYGMVSQGAPSLGALGMGWLAESVGLQLPVLIGGCLTLVVGIAAWILRGRMNAEVEIAIQPDNKTGLES